MRKIIPLLLAVFVLSFSFFPVTSAFAYPGGLLDFQHMYYTTNGSVTNGNVSDSATDGSTATGTTLYSNHLLYHDFPSPVNLTSYKMKAQGSPSYYRVKFYDKFGSVISTMNSFANNEVVTSIDVKNVYKISITNASTNAVAINEIDVFGDVVKEVVHDEIMNLNLTSNYNSVGFTWDIPSTNSNFTGSKIYRNGSLIKTLDKNTKVYTDNTVDALTSYTYKITATYSDEFETTGITKTTTTLETPKPAGDVTNIKANPSYNQVNLSWDNPTDANFDKVNIYRDGVFLSEATSTTYKDSTVSPLTDYEYKITTISTDGLESAGVIKSVKTLKEPAPAIVAGGYTTDENGDYEFTWTEPTTGQVKILIDGQEYQVVDASLLKVLVPKEDMKYDYIGNPKVSLIPISSSGVSGEPTKPDPVDSSSETKVPFSVNDLIGSGMGLLWLIGPFVLLALVFLLVPKLRDLIFGSLRKNGQSPKTEKEKDENTRRFHSTETDIKDKQDKLQLERQEKERLERKQRQEKEAIEKSLKQHRQPREPKMKEYKFSRTERTPKEPRIPRAPRIPRDRTRTTRTPRTERER